MLQHSWDASVPGACPVLRWTQEKERSKTALDPKAASEVYQRSASFSVENSKHLILLRFCCLSLSYVKNLELDFGYLCSSILCGGPDFPVRLNSGSLAKFLVDIAGNVS